MSTNPLITILKPIFKALSIAFFLLLALPSLASLDGSFDAAFRNHSSVMLLIEPSDGQIVDANNAATAFYGYSADELKKLTIQKINMLSAIQVEKERLAAKTEDRNYFIFRHLTAKGKIKTVQVHSSLISVNNRNLLFSIIRDISSERLAQEQLWQYQTDLEAMVDEQVETLRNQSKQESLFLLAGITLLSILCLFLAYLLKRKFESDQRVKTLSQIVEQSPVSIAMLDNQGYVTYGNSKFKAQQALRKEAITPKKKNFIKSYSETNADVINKVQTPHWQGEMFSFDNNNQEFWELTNIHSLSSASDNDAHVVISQDITNFKKNEKRLRLASTVFHTATEAVMICDADSKILAINNAFVEITGYSEQESLGNSPSILSSGHHDDRFYQKMFIELERSGQWQGEISNRRKNGEVYYEWLSITALKNPAGVLEAYVSLFSDITKRKKTEDKIYKQANFDMLTGLSNRVHFADRLEFCLNVAERKATRVALLFIDLDGFKQINDTLGHALGDTLLQKVANRLTSILCQSDMAARLGGDEFAIILSGDIDFNAVETLAKRVVTDIAKPFNLDGNNSHISASVGISIYPEDGIESEALLKNADSAMYEVKSRGRNGYQFFKTNETNIKEVVN